MAIIKDKKIELCVCGKSNQVEMREAKQRVLSWMGTVIIIGFVLTLITYPEFIFQDVDFKGWILLGIIAYIIIGVTYKTYTHIHGEHSPYCAFRRAYLEIV